MFLCFIALLTISQLGTSVPKGEGYGKLVMLDRETLQVQRSMGK